jgi:hypothetical protein
MEHQDGCLLGLGFQGTLMMEAAGASETLENF